MTLPSTKKTATKPVNKPISQLPSTSPGLPSTAAPPHGLPDTVIDAAIAQAEKDILDLDLHQGAAEFSDLVDAAYPPEKKPVDPIETALDQEIALGPEITLLKLDTMLSHYLTENRSLDGLPMRTPAERDEFYRRQRHVADLKAKQINMQTHYRAQQDEMNRKALDGLTSMLQRTYKQ